MSNMVKKRTDWSLIAIVIFGVIFVVTMILLVISVSGNLPSLNMTATFSPSGNVTLTFTGWEAIIVSVFSGVGLCAGIFVRLTRKK